MEVYDFIMIAVLLVAMVLGAWQGLAWQVASVASIVVSYLVARQFHGPVAALIDAEPPWNKFLAMLLLYLGTSLVIWIVFRIVADLIDKVKLKEFDRQAGALLGLLKGVALCVIITLFAVTLLSDAPRKRIIHSYSGYCIAQLINRAQPLIPAEIHGVLAPYLQQLDQAADGAEAPATANTPAENGPGEAGGGWNSLDLWRMLPSFGSSPEAADHTAPAAPAG